MNVAVTDLAEVIVIVQVEPLGASHPVQLANVEPLAGVAVSEIDVPALTDSEQSAPQEMPVPDTVPPPVPSFATVSVYEPPELDGGGFGGIPGPPQPHSRAVKASVPTRAPRFGAMSILPSVCFAVRFPTRCASAPRQATPAPAARVGPARTHARQVFASEYQERTELE